MFHKTVTLSVFALLLAVATCRPQADLNECFGKENGLHPDENDNSAFYVCFNDQVIVHSKCEAGELFDADSKTCTGGSEDQELTAFSDESKISDSVNHMKSQVSNMLDSLESLESEQEVRYPPHRPTQAPESTSEPPTSPPPSPSPSPEPSPQFRYRNKIINVLATENIFPRSILIIGRANREQKNK